MPTSTMNGKSEGISPEAQIFSADLADSAASTGDFKKYPRRKKINSHRMYISSGGTILFFDFIIIPAPISYYFTD